MCLSRWYKESVLMWSKHLQTKGVIGELWSSISHQSPETVNISVNMVSSPVWMPVIYGYFSISIYMLKLKGVSRKIQPIPAVICLEKCIRTGSNVMQDSTLTGWQNIKRDTWPTVWPSRKTSSNSQLEDLLTLYVLGESFGKGLRWKASISFLENGWTVSPVYYGYSLLCFQSAVLDNRLLLTICFPSPFCPFRPTL